MDNPSKLASTRTPWTDRRSAAHAPRCRHAGSHRRDCDGGALDRTRSGVRPARASSPADLPGLGRVRAGMSSRSATRCRRAMSPVRAFTFIRRRSAGRGARNHRSQVTHTTMRRPGSNARPERITAAYYFGMSLGQLSLSLYAAYGFGETRVATLALLTFTVLSGRRSCGVIMTKFSGHAVTFRSLPTVFADTRMPRSTSTRILSGKPPRAMWSAATLLGLYRMRALPRGPVPAAECRA